MKKKFLFIFDFSLTFLFVVVHETEPHHIFSITLRSQEVPDESRDNDAGTVKKQAIFWS